MPKGKNISIYKLSNKRKLFLTLGDIMNLKKGESIEVYAFYSNLCDDIETKKRDHLYKPNELFRNVPRIIFTRSNNNTDLTVQGQWKFPGSSNKPTRFKFDILLTFVRNNTGNTDDKNDVKSFWLPIKKDTVTYCLKGNSVSKHISEFSPNTPIGYEGPMIRKSDIEKYSHIFIDSKEPIV